MNEHLFTLLKTVGWLTFGGTLFRLVEKKLDAILLALQSIKRKEDQMDADFQAGMDAITAQEDATRAGEALLILLFNDLAKAVAAMPSISAADRAAFQAKVAEAKANTADFIAAQLANTPAAPAA